MLVAGAILCPDDACTVEHQSSVEILLHVFHEVAIDPVIIVGPHSYSFHPSVKNRYERFAAFGPLLTALMWAKATPLVTASCETSSSVVERFAAQVCSDDFGLVRQTCDAKRPFVVIRNGDVSRVELDAGGLQKVLVAPVLWPPHAGSLLRGHAASKEKLI